MRKYPGKAMVLGGAAGLGAAFARQLAAAGYPLWLVDRQREALATLAAALRSSSEVNTLVQDLASPEAPEAIGRLLQTENISLLVYVAAHSRIGAFLDGSPEDRSQSLSVNLTHLVDLCHRFGASRRTRGQPGGLILVSSLAGFWGLPGLGLYGATKAFTWNLAEGLRQEWRHYGIDVLALICGAMDTPGFRASSPRVGKMWLESPDVAVREGLRALGTKAFLVAGWRSRLAFLVMSRLLPRALVVRIMANRLRSLYPGRIPPDGD